MPSNTARQRVGLKGLCPGDKRAPGFIDEILTSDNINTLLLMDYSVLLATAALRGAPGGNASSCELSGESEMLLSEAGLSTKKMPTFILREPRRNLQIY